MFPDFISGDTLSQCATFFFFYFCFGQGDTIAVFPGTH